MKKTLFISSCLILSVLALTVFLLNNYKSETNRIENSPAPYQNPEIPAVMTESESELFILKQSTGEKKNAIFPIKQTWELDYEEQQSPNEKWNTIVAPEDPILIEQAENDFLTGLGGISGWYDHVELPRAFELLLQAAELGHIEAQINLGICFYFGWGTEINYDQAIALFTLGTKHNSPWAQFLLGRCYEKGRGVKISIDEAIALYRKAAEQGLRVACYRLGYYYTQELTNKTEGESEYWYQQASETINDNEERIFYFCLNNTHCLEPEMVDKFHWYLCAADAGVVHAQYDIGIYYYNGVGVEINKEKTAEWMKKAAGTVLGLMLESNMLRIRSRLFIIFPCC